MVQTGKTGRFVTRYAVKFAVVCLCGLMFSCRSVIQERRELEELDLGIKVDGITGATRGYGKGVKPPHLRKEGTRHPFMVVPGLRNLALYKPVTGGQKPVRGDFDQLTDGL